MAVPKTLTQAAQDVIDAFNNPDYDLLLKKMEYNVTLKRVLFSDQVSGIGNVFGYLKYHMFDRKPKLVNSGATAASLSYTGSLTQSPTSETNATNGQVSGSGDYLDDNVASGTPTRTPINFTLSFVRKSDKEEWSLIGSFQTLTGPTV